MSKIFQVQSSSATHNAYKSRDPDSKMTMKHRSFKIKRKKKSRQKEPSKQKQLPVEKWLTSICFTPFFIVQMQTMPIPMSRINLKRKRTNQNQNQTKPNTVLEIFQQSFHSQLRSNAEKPVSELWHPSTVPFPPAKTLKFFH